MYKFNPAQSYKSMVNLYLRWYDRYANFPGTSTIQCYGDQGTKPSGVWILRDLSENKKTKSSGFRALCCRPSGR